MKDYISYKDGKLWLESCSIKNLAAQTETPFYAYSANGITNAYTECVKAFSAAQIDMTVHYAVKANTNKDLINLLAREGAGADVVSSGEMLRAIAGGIPADKIIFSGVGKTRDELALALEKRIGQINVESSNELVLLNQISLEAGDFRPNVTIRINPNVDAKTHEKISTGLKHNKFGIDYDDVPALYRLASEMQGINLCGLSVHIGSQILDTAGFSAAYGRLRDMALSLRQEGLTVERLDLGGGMGVDYTNCRNRADFAVWAKAVADVFKKDDFHLAVEPGRSLVAQAGILVTRVIYVKQSGGRKFLIIDAAMNDLIRPALYDAYHHILPAIEPPENTVYETYDIVGPICESGDTFAKDRRLPQVQEGDLLVIGSVGAYGHVMAGTYNMRPLPAEILVDDSQMTIIRPREIAR